MEGEGMRRNGMGHLSETLERYMELFPLTATTILVIPMNTVDSIALVEYV